MEPALKEAPNFPDAGPPCSFENAVPARTKGLLGACLFLKIYLGLKTMLDLQRLAERQVQPFVVLTGEKLKTNRYCTNKHPGLEKI